MGGFSRRADMGLGGCVKEIVEEGSSAEDSKELPGWKWLWVEASVLPACRTPPHGLM